MHILWKHLQFFLTFFLSFSFSSDPILTAFQLSDELKKLKQMESQFCAEFSELRKQVQEFSTSLLGAEYLFFFLLSFPQNERKINKLGQLSLSQFVYFFSTEPSLFTFTKYFLLYRWLCAQKIYKLRQTKS